MLMNNCILYYIILYYIILYYIILFIYIKGNSFTLVYHCKGIFIMNMNRFIT